MFIQIGYQEHFDISSFNSFDDLVEELNDLLGENSYIIERNGKKIDLSNEHQLVEEETYKIWPKVLGGKVNKKILFFRNIRFLLLGWFWIVITFIW
jgi:hypothetical protein